MAKQTKAYLALIFICITWGTTYLAIRIGVAHYPAFLMAGARQATAGIILLIIATFAFKGRDLSLKNILRQMLLGFLMLSIGNGCVTWGEKYIPSGIAALLCSTMPLFAVSLNLAFSRKEHFNATIGIGLLLGVVGVGFIFKNSFGDFSNPSYLAGMGATLLATVSWAIGSIINRKKTATVNPFFNSGLQLFFGGAFMLIMSPFIDGVHSFELWNRDGFLAVCYLTIFGSVLAYAAYMFVLRELPVGVATIYAYINPLVAVILGYLLLGEEMNIYVALAFASIAVSVFMVNRGYRKQKDTIKTDVPITAQLQESVQPES